MPDARFLVLPLLALTSMACGRTTPDAAPRETTVQTTTATAAPATSATSAPSGSAQTSRPAPLSAAARASYSRHLASGRALSEQGRFGEATTELDRALSILPHDPRALTDLGFTTFQSGDLARSARASVEASRLAREPEMRARALYNLGRAREASGRRTEAEDLYRASLALRPNDVVAARLVDLDAGVHPSKPKARSLPCERPMSLEDLCSCLVSEAADAAASPEELAARTCRPMIEPKVPERRARVLELATSTMESTYYLAASSLTGWRVVADLAHVYSPGAFGIVESFAIEDVTEELIGGARTMRVIGRQDRHDSDMGIDEEESTSETTMTVCVLADEKRRTSECPLKAPLHREYRRSRIGLLPADGIDDATRALMTPGLPLTQSSRFEVTLDRDGTATVVLVSGKASSDDRALLGPHKLF